MARKALIHKNTTQTTNNGGVISPKLPAAGTLQKGEIAVNYKNGYETLSIENDAGEVIPFASWEQVLAYISTLDNSIVHKSNEETISGNKTFTGTVSLGSNATATTPATTDNDTSVATTAFVKAAITANNQLSNNYSPSTLTNENLMLESGDTYEEAFGKLEKTVNDNERITAAALVDLDTKLDLLSLDDIPDGSTRKLSDYATTVQLSTKQDTLVSGTNIKTINNQSLLGSGDITVKENVQADWNATSGDAVILNKPDIPDEKLSSSYQTSTLENDNLLLAGGDTYETAFSKMEKAILDNEETTAAALNDLNERIPVIDQELSETSENPVQNKVITQAIIDNEYVISTALNNINDRIENKQNTLISGTNIKTINGVSILGSGNINVSGGSGTGGGGDENIIETVKVNGTALIPDTDKAVDISVPTNVSDLVNDSGYITSYTEIDPTVQNWAKKAIGFGQSAYNGELMFADIFMNNWTSDGYVISLKNGENSAVTGIYTSSNIISNNGEKWDRADDYSLLTAKAIKDKIDIKYTKPSTGIPKTDLASAVQTSLGLADTALQSYTETDPTVPAWAKAANKPSYTAAEVGALPDTTVIPAAPGTLNTTATAAQSINSSEALSGNITLHKVAKTGTYDDLIGKPTIPAAVTESTVSGWGFTKNAGTITGITMNGSSKGTSGVVDLGTVITEHQDISGKANTADLATVATTGSYNDLSNKPTIPAAQVQSDWNATSGMGVILNKPTIPTVNDATLTIQKNGTTVNTFTANASSNVTANIQVNELPTVSSSDNGKILQVVNGAWALVTPVTVYTGTSTPNSSQGINGDLYVQTS